MAVFEKLSEPTKIVFAPEPQTLVLDRFKSVLVVDFDDLVMGQTASRELFIQNPSSMPLTITVTDLPTDKGFFFDIDKWYL